MSTSIHLVFDGTCGFCTRTAGWVTKLDRRHRVELHPAQRPGVLERFGLTVDEANQAAWAFDCATEAADPLRERKRGAAAVNLALDTALGGRVFSAIYRVPGLRWAQDRVYQWVADHRYLLRGVEPWCAQHPDDCAEEVPQPERCGG